MTEILGYIATAFSPGNLLFALIGTILGIIVGALPGFTPTMGIAVLIPVTYTIDPTTALVFLGAIYCGSMFGGSISARNRDEGGALFEIRLPITRRGDLAPNAPADGNRAGGVSGPQPEQIS